MRIARSTAWLSFLWFAFVGALSLLPLSLKRDLHTTGSLHPWGHLLAFAIATILFYQPKAGLPAKSVRILAVILFSVSLEFLQHAIYGNRFELPDVGMDAVGILLGVAIASIASFGRAREASGSATKIL